MKKIKTKEEILADFKKANKDRKAVLANRAGFDTPEEYKEHLISQIKKDLKKPKQEVKDELIKIHNVHLLDCSASMTWGSGQTKFQSAKLGIQTETLTLQKETNVNYVQTLITFSSYGKYKVEYLKKPIVDVVFPENIYVGNTALYEAIVRTLDYLISEHKSGDKVVLKIFTDGEDNNSYRYKEQAKKLINQAKELGITVTFVGTEQDVKRVVRDLGVDETNTLSHDNTSEAVLDSFNTTAMATKTYATRAIKGEDTLTGFYKQSGTI